MKKILVAFLCAAFIAITATGCGQDALYKDSTAATEVVEQNNEDESKVSDADYKDTLDGLCEYFVEKEYIGKKLQPTEMDASLIGAEKGKKYMVNKDVTIELYEYAKNSTADEASKASIILEAAKKTGEIAVIGNNRVKAYVSDSGKYLMIYTDKSINEEKIDENSASYKNREKVVKDFKAFK